MKNTLQKMGWLGVFQVVLVMAIAFIPLMSFHVPTAHGQLINNLQSSCQGTGVRCQDSNFDLASLFKTIINYALGIAFFVAVIYLIYGGFLYITSAGNEESATKGKNSVVYALIGIVIIVLSFVIVSVVYRFVSNNSATL